MFSPSQEQTGTQFTNAFPFRTILEKHHVYNYVMVFCPEIKQIVSDNSKPSDAHIRNQGIRDKFKDYAVRTMSHLVKECNFEIFLDTPPRTILNYFQIENNTPDGNRILAWFKRDTECNLFPKENFIPQAESKQNQDLATIFCGLYELEWAIRCTLLNYTPLPEAFRFIRWKCKINQPVVTLNNPQFLGGSQALRDSRFNLDLIYKAILHYLKPDIPSEQILQEECGIFTSSPDSQLVWHYVPKIELMPDMCFTTDILETGLAVPENDSNEWEFPSNE